VNSVDEGIKVFGEWLFYLDGLLVRREKNLIVQSGLNFLAALLIGEQASDVPVHLALGMGTAAPLAGDTKLVAESLRKRVSAKTRQANMVRFRTYFLPIEANQTWQEFGIFLAGTDVPNTGTLLNRVVPSGGISKASNQTLTVEVRITFTAG
jgi:hypothetical protein